MQRAAMHKGTRCQPVTPLSFDPSKLHTLQPMNTLCPSLSVSQTSDLRQQGLPEFVAAGLRMIIVLGLFTQVAQAARPLITDDARVVDAKACQVESWLRMERERREMWALPGCNFGGDTEFTLGGGRFRDEGRSASDLLAQAKVLIKPSASNGWGAAAAVGVVQHRPLGSDASTRDVYVNVPLSFSFADDRFVLHTNTGWLHEGASQRQIATWGVGTETQLSERVGLVAEAFGQVSRDSFYQIGLRFWVIPNRVQIDTTYGNAIGSAHGDQARWFSIGLRLLSPAFLP